MVLQAGFWGMALCVVLSAWPLRFRQRWWSWNLYLPVAGLALYGLYEYALPAEVPWGGRMAAVLPMLMFLWVNGMAKVMLLTALQEKAGGSRRRLRRLPQRFWQTVVALPILAACAAWYWRARGG